jgi:thymidylate synthase
MRSQYQELIARILDRGERRNDRTGVGTLSIFDHCLTFNLQEGFPLVWEKETRWRTAFLELLWFLRGDPDTDFLHQYDCKLWDAWADEDGGVGPIYGVQWRHWWDGAHEEGVDQIKQLIHGLRRDRQGRRHIVSAWNVGDLPVMALPPCHWAHQCYVHNDGRLDLKLFMRSSDVGLGLPFNIAQYALLTHLYARAAGLTPGRLIVDLGDAHIYANHIERLQALLRLSEPVGNAPKLVFKTDNVDIDGYKPGDFEVEGYAHYPHVPLPVAV